MTDVMNDLVSEPAGFRFTVVGFGAWMVGMLSQLDITQVLGFIGLVVGLLIQIAAYYRNRRTQMLQEEADKRSKEAHDRAKEADEREKALHDLQKKLLEKQIAELDKPDNE